jgi:hypothetical protein
MRKGSICNAILTLALFASAHSADAHGIAGNRFFVGTLTFDDPSVADEAIVPNFSTLNGPVEGGNATDNRFAWSFTRLLTPFLQVQVDSGWIHRNLPTARTSGFATTDVGIKSEIYRNNEHEMLVSTGLLWGVGHSGAQAVGADEPNSILPGVFIGKGFGDLPNGLAWLRPFAITGAFVDELPFGATTTALGFNAPSGKLQSTLVPTVETLHWGLSLQYSTYYLTRRFTGGPPKDEPLNQLLPLVEFSFDTPRGQHSGDDESGFCLCSRRVAVRCRSHRAAQPGRRKQHRISGAVALLPRRPHTQAVRQAAAD